MRRGASSSSTSRAVAAARLSLDTEASRYLESTPPATRRQLDSALADVADEPNWAPGRYVADAGPYSGNMIDLTTGHHRIVYMFSTTENDVRVRLIEPLRPKFPESGIPTEGVDDDLEGDQVLGLRSDSERVRQARLRLRRVVSMFEDLNREAEEHRASGVPIVDSAFAARNRRDPGRD